VARRGRKEVKPSIPMVLWLLVELARDRQQGDLSRLSVLQASKRVAEHLTESFRGGRKLTTETIRRHHKRFENVMRRSNSGEEALRAKMLLNNARQRRELLGWDTSLWALVLDPAALQALGYEVIIGDGN
jgi:hypothetical protein